MIVNRAGFLKRMAFAAMATAFPMPKLPEPEWGGGDRVSVGLKVSNELLQDDTYDIQRWLEQEMARRFAAEVDRMLIGDR